LLIINNLNLYTSVFK